MRCYLFDIDGTLANCDHRKHHIEGEKKDWDAFYATCHLDEPIDHMVELARDLYSHGHLVFVTGRGEEQRGPTQEWLKDHGLGGPPLYMRPAKDYRPDDIVKGELLDQIVEAGYEPIMAFDDRNSVVKMWRARGIPCAQVAEGDF